MGYERKKFGKQGEVMQDFQPKETIKEIEQTVRILISISYDSHKYDFKVLGWHDN